MSEPRIIRTTWEELGTAVTGSGEHSLSPEDVAVLTGIEYSDGFNFADDWHFLDTCDTSLSLLFGGDCPACTSRGHALRAVKDDITLVLDFEFSCHFCSGRKAARKFLPPAYRWVTENKLYPTEKIATPVELQQQLLDEVQGEAILGHSVLYSGPPRAGKSVLAAKILEVTCRDYLERRFNDDYLRLPIFRVNVPEWVDQMMAYRTRDFESSRDINPPEVTSELVRMIRYSRSDEFYGENDGKFPPVIFLEELDKFRATEATRGWLFGLLNAVMDTGGAVVSTCNMTPKELQKHLGDALFRRVVESAIDGKNRVRDFRAKKVG